MIASPPKPTATLIANAVADAFHSIHNYWDRYWDPSYKVYIWRALSVLNLVLSILLMLVVVLVAAILVLLLMGSAYLKPLHTTSRMTSEKMECNGTFMLWGVLIEGGVRLETPLIRERVKSRTVEKAVADPRGRLRR